VVNRSANHNRFQKNVIDISMHVLMSRQAKAGQNITIPRYLTLQSHCEEETRPPFPTIPPPEPKRGVNNHRNYAKIVVVNRSANHNRFQKNVIDISMHERFCFVIL
jgi:hypothetical protein